MKRQLRHLVIFTCITAATAIGSQSAFAGHGSPGAPGKGICSDRSDHRGHRGTFRKMAKELGLSDQQKRDALAIREQQRDQNAPLFDSLRNERRALHALVHSGSADETAIRAQAAKVAALQAELAVHRAAQARQFLSLLTPEQGAKFKELGERRRGGMGDGPSCLEQ